jgi:predicted ribosome quality control (RQC) complex YloA/Tae2 family protein
LLTRHLALELDQTLRGQPLEGLLFDRERNECVFAFESRSLVWSLQRGPRFEPAPAASVEHGLPIPRKATIASVDALADERILRIKLTGGMRANAAYEIVIELLPPEHAVIALDEAQRVLKTLSRTTSRPQTRGQPYTQPSSRARIGVEAPLPLDQWLELLGAAPVEERARLLIARVAYSSPLNADAILDAAAAARVDESELTRAHARYVELLSASVQPCLTIAGNKQQAYGHHLWQEDATPKPTLIGAIADSAKQEPTPLERLESALQRERRKRERLEQERRSAADDARRLRSAADLLLAHVGAVRRGTTDLELPDFDGQTRRLQLDPALSASANAEAWYDDARKRERASERVPELLRQTDQAIARLEDQVQRTRAGESVDLPKKPDAAPRKQPTTRLPYRRYRTSGGLEVRIGRSSRDNDEVTFRHSAPNDIWMHARAVGGAHVVLRWDDGSANPPAQDLREAAILAAVHSKARHAGTVPIDWTRRKYVRKSRGAPAGQVQVERVKTLFVEPNEALEKKLLWVDEHPAG